MFRSRCPQPPHTSPRRRPSRSSTEQAQSTIEFIGTIPLLVLATLICLQAMLCGTALIAAQVAADRAARGLPEARVLQRIPEAWRRGTRITRGAQGASVAITPPAVLPGAPTLTVRATARQVTP